MFYSLTCVALEQLLASEESLPKPKEFSFKSKATLPMQPERGHIVHAITLIRSQPQNATGSARAALLMEWIARSLPGVGVEWTPEIARAHRLDTNSLEEDARAA